jgi:hypothetical protein
MSEPKNYIGSQEHFEDSINAHYDELDKRNTEQCVTREVQEQPYLIPVEDAFRFAEWVRHDPLFYDSFNLWKYFPDDNTELIFKTTAELYKFWEINIKVKYN